VNRDRRALRLKPKRAVAREVALKPEEVLELIHTAPEPPLHCVENLICLREDLREGRKAEVGYTGTDRKE